MAAGTTSALAFAPIHAFPVLWVSFPLLAWLISSGGVHRAFWTGWAFGFGQFAAGLYWIGASFVYTGQFGWIAGGIGVAGLSAGLAVLPAAAVATARQFDQPQKRLIALGVAWVLAEGLRSWLLTGFPWNLTGQVWAFSVTTMQPAAWIGTHGLGAVTVLAALAPAAVAGRHMRLGLLLSAPLAAVLFLGLLRDNVRTLDLGEGPVVRIVQGNVPQEARLDASRHGDNIQQYVDTSRIPPAGTPPKLVIWPEAVLPFDPSGREEFRRDVQAMIPGGARLATGGFRIRPADGAIFNSLFFLAPDGRLETFYDKVHLVPFGEFLPLAEWLPASLLPVTGRGMHAADARARIDLPGFSTAAPAICYEIIFPASTGGPDRPGWLLNVTNDAWFGRTSGPYQHFAQARLRAVEEGLPVIRAANTGISAVIDARGRVLAQLGLGERGVIDHPLPVPEKPPLHARMGDVPLFAGLFALLLIMLTSERRVPPRAGAPED
jgi:apolipoprotein N-acyltransferase